MSAFDAEEGGGESKKRETKKKGKLPGSGSETIAGKSGEGPGRVGIKREENER